MSNTQFPYNRESSIPLEWLNKSSVGVLLLDRELKCIESTPYASELIWTRLTLNTTEQLPEDFKLELSKQLNNLSPQRNEYSTYLLLPTLDDKELLLKVEINRPNTQHEGSPYLFLTIRNASKNAHLAKELKVFRNAVENTGSAVLITDNRGDIEYANQSFSDITGYSFNEIKGKKPSFLGSGETPKSTYQHLWSTLFDHQKWSGTLLNKRKNGTVYWSLQNISPIPDELGNITNFVSVSEDISQIKEHDQQMEKMAYFDPLTDLGNRRNFKRTLQQYLDVPEEKQTGLNALLLLDLDHFKQINDTMGHEAGDALLNTIANRLNFCLQNKTAVFRLGGDEFTIILQNFEKRELIVDRVNEILNLLAQPIQIGVHEVMITVSIGITLIGVDSHDASDLLRNADLAMYYSKKAGRNTFSFYKKHMGDVAKRTLSIEHDLRNALSNKQLRLNYQPQIDAHDGRITAIEALLRWNHPIDGEISPVDFIPHAEETGLIIPIGRWVLLKACKDAQQLQLSGLPAIKVCINLSARQFDDPTLIEHIKDALDQSGLDAKWLELEITESMLMRDFKRAIDTLNRIKEMGISLAIDDFGTGYSSLSHLKKMPVDLLKIDRSFLHDIPQDNDNMAITSTIIAMTKQLGLGVVAEGVETQDQILFLQKNNCVTMQGFLISRPVSFEQFSKEYGSNQYFQPCFLKQREYVN
ncbi:MULTISPECIES: bifunctional diguanylate cyclase/phosphodiesterase [unclassified Neptuniibacter]|uniref:bifunctional diguanylate cyclase/phosphodiesterase n=1 Tax=unclassified Neptuniibacter TaxID=2630693 RepID=UPI000C4E2BA2|nr:MULTISPECIES: bifunctional diguanylate cyclase/phosphodiesterase [unclassified Neptuniibacter]MAY41920.1 GGDEF domain-containing protein [Oceanospirillaceae bacterium]|tara:strand:+ start:8881 stop:10974 length:2094 start_codon:yes stop_codon:yes gene_type:complete